MLTDRLKSLPLQEAAQQLVLNRAPFELVSEGVYYASSERGSYVTPMPYGNERLALYGIEVSLYQGDLNVTFAFEEGLNHLSIVLFSDHQDYEMWEYFPVVPLSTDHAVLCLMRRLKDYPLC